MKMKILVIGVGTILVLATAYFYYQNETSQEGATGNAEAVEIEDILQGEVVAKNKFSTVSTEAAPQKLRRCEEYTETSRIVQYLKDAGVKIPVMLPANLPQDFITPAATDSMLYMESRVMEDGGYSAVMSFNTETNDCAWSQSNHVGRFLGSSEKPDDFEIFKEHGRKVSLKKGITGYLYETGRGDANVQWEYQGTFYLVGDLPLSDAVAIEMANAAIENTQ